MTERLTLGTILPSFHGGMIHVVLSFSLGLGYVYGVFVSLVHVVVARAMRY